MLHYLPSYSNIDQSIMGGSANHFDDANNEATLSLQETHEEEARYEETDALENEWAHALDADSFGGAAAVNDYEITDYEYDEALQFQNKLDESQRQRYESVWSKLTRLDELRYERAA